MSLDVTLTLRPTGEVTNCICSACGDVHEITKPGEEVFTANITHNLGAMAKEAGLYEFLWRADELGIGTAASLIEPLEAGLALLKSDPKRFARLNPISNWGNYTVLCTFVRAYLAACMDYPEAEVSVSR